jgi:hypothetical protein
MRKLYFNGFLVDIDEQTAIGIDIQTYDIKDPGNRKVNVSNSFSIPITSQNLNILGFANNIQSLSTNIYTTITANYYVDNVQFIKDGKIRISEIGERISCIVNNNKSIWDNFKEIKFTDIEQDFFDYLTTTYSYPTIASPELETFENFLTNHFLNKTTGLHLPFFAGNLSRAQFVGDTQIIYAELFRGMSISANTFIDPDSGIEYKEGKGGHFCVYVYDFFKYLEQKYSVDFYCSSSIAYNIWDDTTTKSIYIRLPNVNVQRSISDEFYIIDDTTHDFLPTSIKNGYEGKTLYDLVNAFFQLIGVVVNEVDTDRYRLSRLNDLLDILPIDFSGNTKIKSFKPELEEYAQKNYINFKVVPEGVDKTTGGKTITCLNQNIEPTKDLFEIGSYCPNSVANDDYTDTKLDLSGEKGIQEFVFMINSGVTDDGYVYISYYNTFDLAVPYFSESVFVASIPRAAVYSPVNEYLFLDETLEYPRIYEIEKWLTLEQIYDIDLFNLYFFKELGGSFFINKIKGFNPNSKEPTTLELIFTNYKTPIPTYALEYFVDGVDEAFTDDNGNYFY